MLNSLKIKIHAVLLSLKRKPEPTFVNPYAPSVPVPTSKINPYVTEYGVVKKKSLRDLITERHGAYPKNEPIEKVAGVPECLKNPIPKEPTFVHDMHELFIRDIMGVAARFGTTLKKKERVMTSGEILKACENTKW